MSPRDPRIDAYIARSAEFARPILERLRDIVHEACPQVEETIKWGMPAFVHAGSILCNMAAFKQHASFGFWKHAQVMGEDVPSDGIPRNSTPRAGMGSFGRMTGLADVPPKQRLLALIRKAMRLNEEAGETPVVRRIAPSRPALAPPADLLAALAKNRKAQATFAAFSPSHRRDYVEWVIEAKREDTRQRRIAQAVEWMAEGKPRNWKYMRG